MMDTKAQCGYLILADISGYSSFVAKSELEHAHDILSELLELVLKHVTSLFTVSKLEGDATRSIISRSHKMFCKR